MKKPSRGKEKSDFPATLPKFPNILKTSEHRQRLTSVAELGLGPRRGRQPAGAGHQRSQLEAVGTAHGGEGGGRTQRARRKTERAGRRRHSSCNIVGG